MKRTSLERLFWISGWAYDFSKIATVLLLVCLITHFFFFTLLIVKGGSMLPNYHTNQVLLVNRISYRLDKPKRKDVVAMYYPGETQKRFIKRIIALPGEEIEISDGRVKINGQLLTEDYLPEDTITLPQTKLQLQTGEYFVMGDNRAASSDSRAWGPVPKEFIIGRVVKIVAAPH